MWAKYGKESRHYLGKLVCAFTTNAGVGALPIAFACRHVVEPVFAHLRRSRDAIAPSYFFIIINRVPLTIWVRRELVGGNIPEKVPDQGQLLRKTNKQS